MTFQTFKSLYKITSFTSAFESALNLNLGRIHSAEEPLPNLFPVTAIFCLPCPQTSAPLDQFVTPPQAWSSSASLELSRLPKGNTWCPPVVCHACNVASPSVFRFFYSGPDINDLRLLSNPCVCFVIKQTNSNHLSFFLSRDEWVSELDFWQCPRFCTICHHRKDVCVHQSFLHVGVCIFVL